LYGGGVNCLTSGLKKTEPAKNEKKTDPPTHMAALKIPMNRINLSTRRFNENNSHLPSVVCVLFIKWVFSVDPEHWQI
tara:strand:- start:2775 stop:3008 length:234 start_codon:yes stop_codon:yes gene_type:complete